MVINGNYKLFNTLTLKQIFWKTKNFFKKLDSRFVAEALKIESATFPYITALSEGNVKRNRMDVQNRPITKNGFCQ